jgi:urate oxidase
MEVSLTHHQYGKQEIRLLRVDRSSPEHRITDLTVGIMLSGDQADTHLTGDNAKVLTTDAQKNAAFAFARDGVGEPEDFALRLARHFVDSQPSIHRASVSVEQHPWRRLEVAGEPAHHSFAKGGDGTRTAKVNYDGKRTRVDSGVTGLTVLNSTGSEFWGFVRDEYTTLAETKDRILATAVDASWRHAGTEADWAAEHATAQAALLEAFAGTHSLSLQQTLYTMGKRVLQDCPGIAEVRLSLPNRHHFLVDLTPFGLDNPGEVFYAADRPYGLIEGTVTRDDPPDPGFDR